MSPAEGAGARTGNVQGGVGRYYVTAEYSKPSDVTEFFPDVDFGVKTSHMFGQVKTAGATARKRRLGNGGGGSLYEDTDYLGYLEHLKQFGRRKTPCDLGTMEIFVVDVNDMNISSEEYPNPILTKYDGFKTGHIISMTPDNLVNQLPVVMVYGVTLHTGVSVCLHVFDVFPYLLVECPMKVEGEKDYVGELLRQQLERRLGINSLACLEVCEGETVMGYDPQNHSHTFFKLTFFNSRCMNAAKSMIENQFTLTSTKSGSIVFSSTVYECTVPYTLRWMIDRDIVGCGCIRVSGVTEVAASRRISRCNYELGCISNSIIGLPIEGDYEVIPEGLRLLALDIECISEGSKGFPVPEKDPVIQISTVLSQVNPCNNRAKPNPDQARDHGGPNEARGDIYDEVRIIFTLDTCAPIGGSIVVSFKDERCMLIGWRDTVNILDPDILTGYNFINFDLNYMLVRSRKLDCPNFRNFGRVLPSEIKVHDSMINTKQLGMHENKDINVDGRIQFDIYEIIRREHKLKSYSLNNVCSYFLKEQKEDVHYSQMCVLQHGNDETRKRIAVYCLKDSVLVIKLIHQLSLLVNIIEMARVTGVPVNLLLTRGQQIKVTSQLLRKCKQQKYLMPQIKTSGNNTEVQYEGATVLEPLRGYYDIPIATLDFASLYPSIMIAHNLCYTTLLPDPVPQSYLITDAGDGEVEGKDWMETTPAGKSFVTSKIRRGILPSIVEDLLAARKKAKAELKKCTDPLKRKVLDGRQLALKVSANSVYGYTGAVNAGQLPCLPISESITAFGRTMIEFTKQQVELNFTKKNNYPADAIVVYGDTDSVMVNFGVSDVGEAMKLGLEASKLISNKFIAPISLEFEKIFYPFLLMQKKRYAGLKWTKPEKHDSIDCKGIETVRRDFCLLVQQMLDDALKILLVQRDVSKAAKLVQDKVRDLLMNKIDMSYLVLSKSLGKEDYTSKLAHVELAKKLRQRDPTNAPNVGDRVYYVVIAGYKNQPQYERAEDPLYVLQNNIPIDVDFYLDSLKNSLLRIFEPINKKLADSLFSGSHVTQKKILAGGSSGFKGLGGFITKGYRCLVCRTVINDGSCYCKHCSQDEMKIAQIVQERQSEYQKKIGEFNQLWTQCQRCQESLHRDVICVNRDCPIFYRRIKIRKDIQELADDSISRITAQDPLDW
ncbi:DNA polymerase [Gregarina niphandrodes]|uniref:DNA polymerase n=1 Tax=Gregarina niphandrodes TaxID=110365 RepID=A0A023B2G3_GRENI|nr:DNA polymerase [Gregarina niphandrodes]EZG53813.1 DNA polymerase [Gregarina niphandrodes]|eukprot:XP_011131856.1 DNA polymerase [Gregarina niphandrodes]